MKAKIFLKIFAKTAEQDELDRSNTMREKLSSKTFNDLTIVYDKSVVTLSADILENSIDTCYKEYRIRPSCFVSPPGYTD